MLEVASAMVQASMVFVIKLGQRTTTVILRMKAVDTVTKGRSIGGR